MPITIEQLREDPSIFLLLERIQKEMREEANKRQHFKYTVSCRNGAFDLTVIL